MVDDAFDGFYRDKTVFVTGHTGFKGSWLVLWLKMLGARVIGYALPPEGTPNLFEAAEVSEGIASIYGDVRDLGKLLDAFRQYQPDLVLHLAAQSLVRPSYADPVGTHSTNVMGTVHVLEAVRQTPSVQAAVIVTTDKCYENREWVYAYRENDPLGGHDPYSASKAAAEIVTSSYLKSFFAPSVLGDRSVGVASARAGNVLGGGDWSVDRLIPDCIRAIVSGEPVPVRNPAAIRPWQHVLEPLSGYLLLGKKLVDAPEHVAGAWNFGPDVASHASVRDVVDLLCELWDGHTWEDLSSGQQQAPHEATYLKLDCSKATSLLGWHPVWSFRDCIEQTVAWYRVFDEHPDAADQVRRQIRAYVADARRGEIS